MINAYVKGQALKLSHGKIVADSVNYLEFFAQFLTADWDGLQKYVHFQKGERRIDFPLENNHVAKQMGINLDVGTWSIWIHGSEIVDDRLVTRITTEIQTLIVEASGSTDINGELLPITPPELAEILQAKIGNLDELITDSKSNLVEAVNEVASHEGGGGGTQDHSMLVNRNLPDQHPMSSITGLSAALAEMEQGFDADIDALADVLEATELALSAEIEDKQPKGDYLTLETLPDATTETAGVVKLDNDAVEGSTNAITSGAVYRLLGNANQLADEIFYKLGVV